VSHFIFLPLGFRKYIRFLDGGSVIYRLVIRVFYDIKNLRASYLSNALITLLGKEIIQPGQ
jgi:hypothetical protein